MKTVLIQHYGKWYLFRDVPGHHMELKERPDGPRLYLLHGYGQEFVKGEQLFFDTNEIERWIKFSVTQNRQAAKEKVDEPHLS